MPKKSYNLSLSKLTPLAAYAFLEKFVDTIGTETVTEKLLARHRLLFKINNGIEAFFYVQGSGLNQRIHGNPIKQLSDNQFSNALSDTIENQLQELDVVESVDYDQLENLIELLQQCQSNSFSQKQAIEFIVDEFNKEVLDDIEDQIDYDRISDFCDYECVKFDETGNFKIVTQKRTIDVDLKYSNSKSSLKSSNSLKIALSVYQALNIHKFKYELIKSSFDQQVDEFSKFNRQNLHRADSIYRSVNKSYINSELIIRSNLYQALKGCSEKGSAKYFNDVLIENTQINNLDSWNTLFDSLNFIDDKLDVNHGFDKSNVMPFCPIEIFKLLENLLNPNIDELLKDLKSFLQVELMFLGYPELNAKTLESIKVNEFLCLTHDDIECKDSMSYDISPLIKQFVSNTIRKVSRIHAISSSEPELFLSRLCLNINNRSMTKVHDYHNLISIELLDVNEDKSMGCTIKFTGDLIHRLNF